MDNAPAHVLAVKELDGKLKHTQVVFLPKNTTAHTQPLDAGIIQTFILGYRQILYSYVMHKLKIMSVWTEIIHWPTTAV